MIELLESELGIALLTMASGLVGAIIAISGNVAIEHMKYKKNIKNDMREKELSTYGYVLTILISLVSNKRTLAAFAQSIKVDENGNADIGEEIRDFIFDLFKKNDELALETLPKVSMYATDEIREMFLDLYLNIQLDNELIADVSKEGIEKYCNEFDINGLERKIREQIRILKKS